MRGLIPNLYTDLILVSTADLAKYSASAGVTAATSSTSGSRAMCMGTSTDKAVRRVGIRASLGGAKASGRVGSFSALGSVGGAGNGRSFARSSSKAVA